MPESSDKTLISELIHRQVAVQTAAALGEACAAVIIRSTTHLAAESMALRYLQDAGCYVRFAESPTAAAEMVSAGSLGDRRTTVILTVPDVDGRADPAGLEMTPMCPTDPADIEQYIRLVRPSLDDSDYLNPQELRHGRPNRPVLSWFAKVNDEVVGWAGLVMPSRYVVEPGSVHLMGMVVAPAWRRMGVGGALLDYRLALIGDAPVSVSIQPGKKSESLVAARGFTPGDAIKAWRNWYRYATPRATAVA